MFTRGELETCSSRCDIVQVHTLEAASYAALLRRVAQVLLAQDWRANTEGAEALLEEARRENGRRIRKRLSGFREKSDFLKGGLSRCTWRICADRESRNNTLVLYKYCAGSRSSVGFEEHTVMLWLL